MLAIIIAVSSCGCTGNPEKNMVSVESPVINTIANSTAAVASKPVDTSISDSPASVSDKDNSKAVVIIKTYYEKPVSLKNKDTILLKGVQQGEEYIEVTVIGEIFDFEQITLTWDESKSELKEKEVVKSFKSFKNQTLVIKTYQPEGIPTEKIKWKSTTGKTYEYLIAESSLDKTGNNTKKFEMK